METNFSQRTRDAGVFHERLRGASEAPSRSNRLARELVYPVRDEDVRLMRVGVVPLTAHVGIYISKGRVSHTSFTV